MISELNYVAPIGYRAKNVNAKMNLASSVVDSCSPAKQILCRSGQSTSIESYERRLKDIEKHLKNCKRENYETVEEFQKDYDYWTKKYEQVQAQMMEADNGYTVVNTDAKTKKIGAVGQFFKDCCDGIKALGMDIINGITDIFKPKAI